MIFSQYAIDPALFNEWVAIKDITDNIKLHHGRILAEYPKRHWAKMAFQTIDSANLQDAHKKSAIERIMQLRREHSIRSKRPYDRETNWANNALNQPQHDAFDEVIHGARDAKEGRIYDQFASDFWPVHMEAEVPRTTEEYMKPIKTLIADKGAQRLTLVDPYFFPWDKKSSWPLVQQLVKELRDNQFIEFHIDYGVLNEKGYTLDEIKRLIEEESPLPKRTPLTFFVWSNLRTGKTLHDRVFFTEKSGFRSTFGFGVGDSNDERPSILSVMTKDLLQTFQFRFNTDLLPAEKQGLHWQQLKASISLHN